MRASCRSRSQRSGSIAARGIHGGAPSGSGVKTTGAGAPAVTTTVGTVPPLPATCTRRAPDAKSARWGVARSSVPTFWRAIAACTRP